MNNKNYVWIWISNFSSLKLRQSKFIIFLNIVKTCITGLCRSDFSKRENFIEWKFKIFIFKNRYLLEKVLLDIKNKHSYWIDTSNIKFDLKNENIYEYYFKNIEWFRIENFYVNWKKIEISFSNMWDLSWWWASLKYEILKNWDVEFKKKLWFTKL